MKPRSEILPHAHQGVDSSLESAAGMAGEKLTMGLFDVLLGSNSDNKEFDQKDAFAGVLLVIIGADGIIDDDEVRTFGAIVNRMDLYREQSSQEFGRMMDRLMTLIRRSGPDEVLARSAGALDRELRETAFVVAVDLALADGRVEREELAALQRIQTAFEISNGLAEKTIEIIQIKNRG